MRTTRRSGYSIASLLILLVSGLCVLGVVTLAQGPARADSVAPEASQQVKKITEPAVDTASNPMAVDITSVPPAEARAGNDATGSLAPDAVCPNTVLPNDNSTSGNERAPTIRNRYGRSVYLIKASELAASGLVSGAGITGIGWSYQTAPGLSGSGPLIVYLQNTTDTTNLKSTTWATAIAGMTTVHNATTTLPNVTGPFDIAFSGGSPFTYTGGGLYVAFDMQYPVGTLSTTAVVWCNSTGLIGGLLGAQSSTSPPTTIAASNFRPETRLTPTVGPQNEASVDYVIAYGQLPQGEIGPQTIKAIVTNKGGSALTNLPVTLNVAGADTFTDTQTVASLASCGGQTTVSFAPFTPVTLGNDTLTVTVPADDNNGNNSVSRTMTLSTHTYSYKHPGTTPGGGVGLTGATGQFMGKFAITGPDRVASVIVEFPATNLSAYRISIYGDDGTGKPGAQLYTDAADRSVTVTGSQTITLPAPVPVGPGNFFVGIQQTNTTNVGLSFDAETPIRSGAFYISTTLNAGPWSDFSPGNNFKLNIGLNLTGCLTDGDCNDNNVCTNDSCNTGTGLCVATPNTAPCNDNNACTSNDTCGGGVCAGTPSVVCNDNDPCTADACDPATGQCLYTPTTGGSCSDGNACTGPDLCGCISTGTLTEYFDEVATPSLPSGWTTTVTPGTANAWVTSSTASDTPPNSAFTDDPATVTDKSLFSPAFLCGGGQVSFMNSYNTESTFDGMVLEIKIGAGAFQDILAAGGSFASGGYNGTISANFSNPLGGRQAWTGNSSGFVPTIVNLPASATGKVVVLRWRLGSDTSASATGAFIDSVSLPTCTSGCLPGGPANCNDNNPCTDDSCNPGTGCVYANNANACDDGNPCTANDTCGGGACTGTAVGAPPEVSGVTFALNKQTLSWASALTATNYDAVRGALAALPVGPGGGDEVCFDNLPGTSMVDGAVPVTGAGFWYIVRGESACGNGSYGQASGGSPRITTTCP